MQFKSIAMKINETKKNVEILERLTVLQEKIINLPISLKRLASSSRVIYNEGLLLETSLFSNSYFYVFVFSDVFFITKQRRTCWEFKTSYATRGLVSAVENEKDDGMCPFFS
jgi:hypothetical protein